MKVMPRGVWALAIVGISVPLLTGIGVWVYRIMSSQLIWGSAARCVGYMLMASLWNAVPFVVFVKVAPALLQNADSSDRIRHAAGLYSAVLFMLALNSWLHVLMSTEFIGPHRPDAQSALALPFIDAYTFILGIIGYGLGRLGAKIVYTVRGAD